VKRRRALAWLLLLPLGYPLVRWAAQFRSRIGAAPDRRGAPLDGDYADELKVITRALLPSALSRAEADAVAIDFTTWLANQKRDAELSHLGAKLRRENFSVLRPGTRRRFIDGTNYRRQIDQLRTVAAPRRLAQLDRLELTMVLTSALEASRAVDIPPGPLGSNVLVDILSFFYRRPSAVDLFYGRRVGALSCRSLDGVDRIPAPLTGTG